MCDTIFDDLGRIFENDWGARYVALWASCLWVVRRFVRRNYDEVLMEVEKFSDNLKVTEKRLVYGVDRVF